MPTTVEPWHKNEPSTKKKAEAFSKRGPHGTVNYSDKRLYQEIYEE